MNLPDLSEEESAQLDSLSYYETQMDAAITDTIYSTTDTDEEDEG